jgi:hypothetical protein
MMAIALWARVAPALLAAALGATEAAADCTCRAGGRDYDLGRSICLTTPAGFRLATCEMVLNNTSWKISATPCVDASAAPAADEAQPSGHAGHHHAHHGG